MTTPRLDIFKRAILKPLNTTFNVYDLRIRQRAAGQLPGPDRRNHAGYDFNQYETLHTIELYDNERYGTPLGTTLRVMAQENRDMRMSEAEKKAAAPPPKLTVPMILFFLPVLFVVILGPAAIRVMALQ